MIDEKDYQRAVEEAFKRGAKIETGGVNQQWAQIDKPTWNWGHFNYRVAPPEPRKRREYWIEGRALESVMESLLRTGTLFSHLSSVPKSGFVHMREVLPGEE